METLEEKFKKMHLLGREERLNLVRELELQRPEFLKPFYPRWWWWRRCRVKVLVVCDGGLNFGTTGFGLSEFLTTFNELQATSNINYEVTLAHRGTIINSTNPLVVDHISNFNFDTSVNLEDFDQIWMFAINPAGNISPAEVTKIEDFMNGGGGVFATGDHGLLGKAMCGDIDRIKDMRHWEDFPVGFDSEVSMSGRRRNDTNTPQPGNSTANTFDHQSDGYPQNIAVRTFGNGMPHPLLSISSSIRPSGIIDIMPDHPHEGECKPETSFTVNGTTVPTQIISTSFVVGGNTSGGKTATDPHCFPSIAVWDGCQANVGRIVVDSTWHHFVNINLNGSGSAQSGLSTSDFEVIRHYFMNITKWISRKKLMICWWPWQLFYMLKESQLVEASLNDPSKRLKEISVHDLKSIGSLAEELLADKFGAANARSILVDLFEEQNKEIALKLDSWNPLTNKNHEDYDEEWINLDLIFHTAIGAGFMALREDKKLNDEEISEKELDQVLRTFRKGMEYGLSATKENFESSLRSFAKIF